MTLKEATRYKKMARERETPTVNFEYLKKDFIFEVRHPEKDKKSSVVLSKEKAKKIMNITSNIKHKAILMFEYSGRLRAGEVVKLKPEDIDSNRELIHIRASKGRKNRCTLLSDVELQTLREQRKKEKPQKWLFPSWDKGKHITARTVQKIFQNACKKAGIKKGASVHSLRHSFDPHILESGIDLRHIQELLGYKSSKTTETYTHASKANIVSIKSPLDTIFKEEHMIASRGIHIRTTAHIPSNWKDIALCI